MIIIGFVPSLLVLYFYLPFLALYHGIQGFFKDRIEEADKLCCMEDARDLTFLKLFEQFGEALPSTIHVRFDFLYSQY